MSQQAAQEATERSLRLLWSAMEEIRGEDPAGGLPARRSLASVLAAESKDELWVSSCSVVSNELVCLRYGLWEAPTSVCERFRKLPPPLSPPAC